MQSSISTTEILFLINGGKFFLKVDINNLAVPETLPGPWTEEGLTETKSKFLSNLNAAFSAKNLDSSYLLKKCPL